MEYRADALERAAKIRMIVMDVDGTLTDGRIYIGDEGEVMKEFSIKDGMGITMLHKAGIETAIITGRTSKIVEHRAAELKIDRVWQGIEDKRAAWQQLRQKTGYNNKEIAYVGDDLNDLFIIQQAGLACCTADASSEIKRHSHVTSSFCGGNGAVRQIAEFILKTQGKWQSIVEGYGATASASSRRK